MKWMLVALAVASMALAGCAPNQTSKQGQYDEVIDTTTEKAADTAATEAPATEDAASTATK